MEIIFNQVENLVEQHPDSALRLLDSIQNPYELNEKQYAEYILLMIKAKDKNGENISTDTLVFQVKDYYLKKGDKEEKASAEFYCGRVYQSQGKTEKAMQAYLEAETIAEETDNNDLKGFIQYFIGELNYNKFLHNEAIDRFKNANLHFSESNDYKKVIPSLNAIANCFLIQEKKDSAFFYYNKGLELANSIGDSIRIATINQNMGIVLLEFNSINHAKEHLFEAIKFTTNSKTQARTYQTLSKAFEQENAKDSALYYANLALQVAEKEKDTATLANIYKLLSKIEEKSGNYPQSLNYHQQYSKYLSFVLIEKNNSAILDVQKKYNFELIKNAHNKLLIERQWFFIGFILAIFTIVTVSFFFYRKKSEDKQALLMAEQQIYQLKEMVNTKSEVSDKKSNELRKTIIERFNLLKKIALLENYLVDENKDKGKELVKKVNGIIYGRKDGFDWDILYQSINNLHDNYLEKLQKALPQLNEMEYRICCLVIGEFNDTEIATLLRASINSIRMKKSRIRQKIGMKEKENFLKKLKESVLEH